MKRSDALEDAADVATFDERMRDLKSGKDAVLPADVSASILKGDSLLRAVRRSKDMTQADLAGATDLAQEYIGDLEAGRETATNDAWASSRKGARRTGIVVRGEGLTRQSNPSAAPRRA